MQPPSPDPRPFLFSFLQSREEFGLLQLEWDPGLACYITGRKWSGYPHTQAWPLGALPVCQVFPWKRQPLSWAATPRGICYNSQTLTSRLDPPFLIAYWLFSPEIPTAISLNKSHSKLFTFCANQYFSPQHVQRANSPSQLFFCHPYIRSALSFSNSTCLASPECGPRKKQGVGPGLFSL